MLEADNFQLIFCCAGHFGHPFRKLSLCTSPIFLFFHFPLVNDMELLREWKTDL